MNVWLWRVRQVARRLGIGALSGLALLAVAMVLQEIRVESVKQAIHAQHARVASLQQAAARRAATPAPRPFNPLATLPQTGEASQLIGEIERLAHANGLALPRGQYRVSTLTGTTLQRWQLVLPMVGSYPALHAFVATALERLPNLTLDELKLKRDRIESTDLQAELRLSLFVEAAP